MRDRHGKYKKKKKKRPKGFINIFVQVLKLKKWKVYFYQEHVKLRGYNNKMKVL